jgi:hypothetical protein
LETSYFNISKNKCKQKITVHYGDKYPSSCLELIYLIKLNTRNPWFSSFLVSSKSSFKETIIGTTSSGIWDQLRTIYFIYRWYGNVVIYKWNVHNGIIEITCVKNFSLICTPTLLFCYLELERQHIFKFGDLVDQVYPIELEIRDTTDTMSS